MRAVAVDVLLLAAGGSRRYGGCKLLASWGGVSLFERALRKAAALGADSVNLVLGGYGAELAAEARRTGLSVNVWHNPEWAAGIGHSLAFGASRLAPDKAVLVMLADQPLVAEADLRRLLDLGQAHPNKIVCAEFSATLGVPALFPPKLKIHLQKLRGDRGAKALLLQHAADLVRVPLASAAIDIDSPQDLAELSRSSR